MRMQMRMAFSNQARSQRAAKSLEDFTELRIFFHGSGFQLFAFFSAQPFAQMPDTLQLLQFYSFTLY